MHFWIDKRSQTCGFSGRHRVPASLSAAGCGQHQRRQRRLSRAKPMVTPLHRFQPIECVAGVGGGGGGGGGGGAGGGGGLGSQHCARRSLYHHQQLQHHHHRQLQNCFPSAYSGTRSAAHAAELDSSVFLDLPLDGSGDHNATHNNDELEPQMISMCVKCAAWAFVVLVIASVAGAKFYIDQQEGHGLDILIFFSLMAVFLLLFCIFSMYRSKETRDGVDAAVTSSQAPHSTNSHQGQTQVHETEIASSEDTGLGQITDQASTIILAPTSGSPQVSELPPPPYHIAILLPQQTQNSGTVQADDESPPPSYDKAVS